VPDRPEEALDPRGEAPIPRGGNRRPVPGRVFEPERGRIAHNPGDGQHLLVAGTFDAPLPEVHEVGAGPQTVRRLVELLARPGGTVRAAVGIQKPLESLRYVQVVVPKSSMFV
jgi:hypothetical protein